jgi:dynein heavy chain
MVDSYLQVSQHLRSDSRKLDIMFDNIMDRLNYFTSLIKGNTTPLEKNAYTSLMINEVHNRDIVKELREGKVTNINDFLWTSQMRYYWEDDECYVRMVNATIPYGYEYLGTCNETYTN